MPLKVVTAGESHGPGLTTIVEGLPAGLELDQESIDGDMARRQLGHGRGGRMKIEKDSAQVTAGVRHGRTLGGPVALQVANRDFKNWEERMNPWPVEADVPEVHLPRPGHADLAGVQKFGFTDVRNVLERAQRRETAARVAGGALAKTFLRALGVEVVSHVIQIGAEKAPLRDSYVLADFVDVDASPVRCLDADATKAMVQEINVLRKKNESIGGIFELRAYGLVPGLGSHVSWETRLDGRIAGALLSIQAAKGVGLGDGFDLAGRPGLGGPRRDLLLRRARLLPRDEPLRRARGRDDDGRAARRARGDEADPDPDQAAALGRHRDPRASDHRSHQDRSRQLLHLQLSAVLAVDGGGAAGGRGGARTRRRRDVPLGLYLHIPFCRKRCKFCYFRVYTDKNAARRRDAMSRPCRARSSWSASCR